MCRVYELKVSIKPLNSELRESPRMKRQEDCKSKRGWSTPRKQGLLYQLSNAHINSLRKKQQVRSGQVLHGSTSDTLHIYYIYYLCIFMEFLTVKATKSLTSMLVLGAFFLLYDIHVQIQYDSFCCILLYFILPYWVVNS